MDKNGYVKCRSQHVSTGVYFILCSKVNTQKMKKQHSYMNETQGWKITL